MTLALHENTTAKAVFCSRKSNAHAKSTEGFAGVERRRKAARLAISALARAAGISESTYTRLLQHKSTPQRRILIRLNAALDRMAGQPARPSADIIAGLYRAALVTFAAELGADVALALTAVSLSNLDEANRRAGRARRLAFYVTVNAYEIPRPDVSRAVGYSKQAASKALREIEDMRGDNAEINALVLRVGNLLTGKDLT